MEVEVENQVARHELGRLRCETAPQEVRMEHDPVELVMRLRRLPVEKAIVPAGHELPCHSTSITKRPWTSGLRQLDLEK